jgi:hypothetical protein
MDSSFANRSAFVSFAKATGLASRHTSAAVVRVLANLFLEIIFVFLCSGVIIHRSHPIVNENDSQYDLVLIKR